LDSSNHLDERHDSRTPVAPSSATANIEDIEVVWVVLRRIVAVMDDAEFTKNAPRVGPIDRDVEVDADGRPGVGKMQGLVSGGNTPLRLCSCW
jgi:hypothetical protein